MVELDGGGRAWVGEAFWLDAIAAAQFIAGVADGGPFEPDRFSAGPPTTAATNTLALVVELPLALVSREQFVSWSTVAAHDHGTWTQVARCGRPNLAAAFVDDPERSTAHNTTTPEQDLAEFSRDVEAVVERLTRAAGTATDPADYARLAARALLPDVLPYAPAQATGYGFAGVNGRGLRDDLGAVTYSIVFNFPMRTGLDPLPDLRDEFPHLPPPRPLPSGPGSPYPTAGRADAAPSPRGLLSGAASGRWTSVTQASRRSIVTTVVAPPTTR